MSDATAPTETPTLEAFVADSNESVREILAGMTLEQLESLARTQDTILRCFTANLDPVWGAVPPITREEIERRRSAA